MNLFNKQFFSKKNSSKRLLIAVFLVVFLVGAGYVFTKAIQDEDSMFALVLAKVLVNFTNEDRSLKNINSLTVNPLLEKAAQMKAEDMIAKGYFAHQSPDGHSPWYWLDKVGYDFSSAGENLAVNFSESSDVNHAWLNSPKHKENIMNPNFTEIGIAVAEGMYQGKMTTFVVQFFGKPIKTVTKTKNLKTPNVNLKNNTNISTSTNSTEEKILNTASSTVLGASDQKIIYEEVEKVGNPKDSEETSFWKKIWGSWF